MATATTPEAFLTMIEDLPELKTFPAAAARLMAEVDNPDLSPKRIAETVSCDPAIAGHMLQIANSPLYGYSGQIRTIEHAVVVLGMRSLQNLILTMAGSSVFSQGETALAQRQALWLHSLSVATTGRVLADYCLNLAADEAFLAGIFHDVGKLVIFDLAAETYLNISPELDAAGRVDWERQHLGIDHAALGMECADNWGLPSDIADAIGQHHAGAPDMAPLSRCTYIADLLAHRWDLTSTTEAVPPTEDEAAALAEELRRVGTSVTGAELLEVRDLALADYQELLQAFS